MEKTQIIKNLLTATNLIEADYGKDQVTLTGFFKDDIIKIEFKAMTSIADMAANRFQLLLTIRLNNVVVAKDIWLNRKAVEIAQYLQEKEESIQMHLNSLKLQKQKLFYSELEKLNTLHRT